MKTIFTLFFVALITLSSYSQNSPGNRVGNGIPVAVPVNATSFSIEKMYPNPVFDQVTLDVRSDVTGPVRLSLYNILGTEVKKWDTFDFRRGIQQLKLDLSFLKSGVYILKMSCSGQIHSQVLKKS